jgi:hypothetical protein
MREARRAGKYADNAATLTSNSPASAIVKGSFGAKPKSMLAASR